MRFNVVCGLKTYNDGMMLTHTHEKKEDFHVNVDRVKCDICIDLGAFLVFFFLALEIYATSRFLCDRTVHFCVIFFSLVSLIRFYERISHYTGVLNECIVDIKAP